MRDVPPLDPERDHVRGGAPDAPYELLLYGDYECPFTRRAMGFVKALEQRYGSDLRFAYRHFPLPDHHPHAQHAAEASEAAAAQGGFWDLHDRLFQRPEELSDEELAGHAAAVGLDPDRVRSELASGMHAERVREDVATATAAGIRGTPSFVVGGVRLQGFYDLETLSEALEFGV
jgi:protein-disulfide isomerase